MSFLGILKQKKKEDLELPPPPKPELLTLPSSEIPEIKPGKQLPPEIELEEIEMPEFPTISTEEETIPAPTTQIELPTEEPNEEQNMRPQKRETEQIIFDKTVHSREDRAPEIIHWATPLRKAFVSVDDYSTISNSADTIQYRLSEAEALVRRLNDLKVEENKTIDKWLEHLEDVEKKLTRIDKVLAKAQS